MSLSKTDKANRLTYLRDTVNGYDSGLCDAELSERGALWGRFSPRNCFLILAQRGEATECAGFHEWRKVGRSVAKGAKGIAIMVPMSGTDKDGDSFVRFSYRYVFDIADTLAIS